MSTLNLDELERLLAEATPGPWKLADQVYDNVVDAMLAVDAVNALPALIAAARERDRLRLALEKMP